MLLKENLKQNCEGVALKRKIIMNYNNMGVLMWSLKHNNIMRQILLRRSFLGSKASLPPPSFPLRKKRLPLPSQSRFMHLPGEE